MSFFQRLCSASFPPVSRSFPEPCPGPQCCLYSLLEGQPENGWPLGGKYCIISCPSRYSDLHLPLGGLLGLRAFPTTCAAPASLSEPAGAGERHTVPARSPPVGILSKATGLPGIMFATLRVSPACCLGPNPYHPSPKVKNISLDQISTPLLWNIWSVVS